MLPVGDLIEANLECGQYEEHEPYLRVDPSPGMSVLVVMCGAHVGVHDAIAHLMR
jgi:hypothetical protein